MQQIEALAFDCYYHIYNRGINGCDLFKEPGNYEYFLGLYNKHITPVADTYAWVLMPNHFHFLVRINTSNLTGFENLSDLIKPPHQYFSNLFNAYTKAFNKRYDRHGALFERPFKRKKVGNDNYLKQLILYIHNNPIHHGFCEQLDEYPWSSYLTCISEKPTKLNRKEVIDWFDDKYNFKYMHNSKVETEKIEQWLEL